jgi:hypothetical protein
MCDLVSPAPCSLSLQSFVRTQLRVSSNALNLAALRESGQMENNTNKTLLESKRKPKEGPLPWAKMFATLNLYGIQRESEHLNVYPT